MLEAWEDECRLYVPRHPRWAGKLRLVAGVMAVVLPLVSGRLGMGEWLVISALWVPYLLSLAFVGPLLLPWQTVALQRRRDGVCVDNEPAPDWGLRVERAAFFSLAELRSFTNTPPTVAGDLPEDVELSGSVGGQIITVERAVIVDFLRPMASIWFVLSCALLIAPVIDGLGGWFTAPFGSILLAAGLLAIVFAVSTAYLASGQVKGIHQIVLRPGHLSVDGEQVPLEGTQFAVMEFDGYSYVFAVREGECTELFRTRPRAAAWVTRELRAMSRDRVQVGPVPEQLLKLRGVESQ